jgi:LuxR family maltose regulon positive regulatory protein
MEAGPLVTTKFRVPEPRPGTIGRRALVAALPAGGARVTLIAAPAGSGKSTLLTEWAAAPNEQRPFAWFSLDTGDDDPIRFWSGIVEAFRTCLADVGEGALMALRTGTEPAKAAAAALVNELAERGEPVVLVLDDLHTVTGAAVHESLALLVERAPPELHVAISTRVEPPLPLGRLRTRGELHELRAAELRFTDEEAAALLNGSLDLDLPPEDVSRLQARTEGWAAGLYLAGLSLRGRSDSRGFVDEFAGDDRHVADFLVAEVLDMQAPDLREFLLRTSILDRLGGAVCDAVLDASGSAGRLEQLERSNLFVIALDDRRRWYRYHHLFAQLLRHELLRSSPQLVPELHRRASAWHRAQGAVDEAVRHAIAAGDHDEAVELVAAEWWPVVQRGEYRTVERWLAALPEELVRGDARLAVARAWALTLLGRQDELGAFLEGLDESELSGELPYGHGSLAVALDTAVIGQLAFAGRLREAARAAEAMLEARLATGPGRATPLSVLGTVLLRSGEYQRATAPLEESIAIALDTGQLPTGVVSHAFLALARLELEGPAAALATADEGLRIAADRGLPDGWPTGNVHLARGRALQRAGRTQEARAEEELARRELGAAFGPHHYGELLLLRGLVARDLGDRQAARNTLARARVVLSAAPEPGPLLSEVEAAERSVAAATRPPHAPGERLSERELVVLRLLRTQLSLAEIARELYVSHNTVKTQTRAIYRKLGVSSREEAVDRARAEGLLSPG